MGSQDAGPGSGQWRSQRSWGRGDREERQLGPCPGPSTVTPAPQAVRPRLLWGRGEPILPWELGAGRCVWTQEDWVPRARQPGRKCCPDIPAGGAGLLVWQLWGPGQGAWCAAGAPRGRLGGRSVQPAVVPVPGSRVGVGALFGLEVSQQRPLQPEGDRDVFRAPGSHLAPQLRCGASDSGAGGAPARGYLLPASQALPQAGFLEIKVPRPLPAAPREPVGEGAHGQQLTVPSAVPAPVGGALGCAHRKHGAGPLLSFKGLFI